MVTFLLLLAGIALVILGGGKYLAHKDDENVYEELMSRYNHAEIVCRIINKEVWQGQTADQLKDSLGEPVDKNTEIMKSKTRETWKYNQKTKNQFGLKITLENNIVVGWKE